MSFQDYSIKDYNLALGAKKSTPGGGSVLGLTLQLACNLNKMVINFTIGKKGYENVEERMKVLLEETNKLEALAIKLCDDDSTTFKLLMDAYKTGDKETIEKASMTCCEVPYTLYLTTEKVEDIARELMLKGNKNVVSDARIASDLCVAIYPGCKANIEANISSISSQEFINRMKSI